VVADFISFGWIIYSLATFYIGVRVVVLDIGA
jgi:hypothetical protein